MIPREGSWSIVFVGFWNRMIFSPNWVAENVYEEKEIEFLVAFDPKAPIIFRSTDVELRVADARLDFVCLQRTETCLSRTEKLACRVFEKLPVTPITAVGINFGFEEAHPSEEHLQLFNFGDDADIATGGWNLGTKEIKRALSRESYQLKLTYGLSNSCLKIDLNFHHPVSPPQQAVDFVRDKTLNRYHEGLNLIKQALKLRLEE